MEDLVALAKEILPYNMQHNAETEACDLLMEIERLELLDQYVDKNSFQRVCLYLTRSVTFGEKYDYIMEGFNVFVIFTKSSRCWITVL